MTALELIEKLKVLVEDYGDLDVHASDCGSDHPAEDVWLGDGVWLPENYKHGRAFIIE
jgi:hypothetical protein